MMSIHAISTVVALSCLMGSLAPDKADPAHEKLYVICASKQTRADADWRAVVDELAAKHDGKVVEYDGDVADARAHLARWMPDYVCFVARPEEAGRKFVVAVHRMMRRLDGDFYTDAVWAILTGYDAADAMRIAKRKAPLVVRRAAGSMGPGVFKKLDGGFASSESNPRQFWTREPGGKTVRHDVTPDPAQTLANAFNTMKPQMFVTSGHATEHDWQIGYNVRAGQFRHKNGQLRSISTNRKGYRINSPEPKVYLPAGNCLIGHIDRRDCMATAWMHSGGVHQMYGYTAVTFNGYMGWGTLRRFGSGACNLAEAFYWTNQHLLYDLHTKYPKLAGINFERHDNRAVGWLIRRHKLTRPNPKTGRPQWQKEATGLLWDRDCVAFYGDPAWDARMPKAKVPGTHAWSKVGKTWTLTVTPDKAGKGSKALDLFLPQRLTGLQMVAGKEHVQVVTDNFIWYRHAGKGTYTNGAPVTVRLKGTPMVRPRAGPVKPD